MTDDEINQWIANAKPGDRLVYHRGDLSADARGNTPLRIMRETLWHAMRNNHIRLIQRRRADIDYHGGAAYDYIAIRRDAANKNPGQIAPDRG